MRRRALRVGWMLLAVSSVGLLAAPVTILRNRPDLATRTGRHVLAGAAAALPFVVVGLPILFVDATHVAAQRLRATLAPQVAGLAAGSAALVLCAVGVRRRA